MEPQTSTRKWRTHAGEIEAAIAAFTPQLPELEFPVDPTFDSKPPHLDPVAMYWRGEELMRQGARKHDYERRRDESIEAEFTM